MKNSYASNSFINLMGTIIYVGLNIILTPFLINTMGEVEFGLYRLALYTLVGYGASLDFGLRAGIQRALSDAINENRIEDARLILGMAVRIYAIICAIVLIIAIPIVIYYPYIVKTPTNLITEFRFLIFASIIYLFAYLFQIMFNVIFIVLGRFDYYQITYLLGRILFIIIGLILMTLFGHPLIMIGSSAAIIMTATCFYSLRLAKKEWADIGFTLNSWNKEIFKFMQGFGFHGFIISISSILVYSSLNIIISNRIDIISVTIFAIALMIASQFETLLTTVATPIYAEASKHRAQKDTKKISNQYLNVVNITMLMYIIIASSIIPIITEILDFWIGKKSQNADNIAIILILGLLCFPFKVSANAILNAAGAIKDLSIISIIWAFAVICPTILVSFFLKINLYEIAIYYAVTMIIKDIIIFITTCKQLEIKSYMKILTTMLSKEIVSFAIALLVSYTIQKMLLPSYTGITSLISLFIISFVFVCIIVYKITIPKESRFILSKKIKNLLGKIKNKIIF